MKIWENNLGKFLGVSRTDLAAPIRAGFRATYFRVYPGGRGGYVRVFTMFFRQANNAFFSAGNPIGYAGLDVI